MTMTTTQLRDLLYDAQAELFNAIEHLERYVRDTDDREAESYIVEQLKIIASRDHGFLAGDLNLDDLMERLDEEDDKEEDDLPDVKVVKERPLFLLRKNLGPILNEFGEPVYVTIPTD